MTTTEDKTNAETELELVRDYAVDVARLWRAVTDPEQVVRWFGPQGTRIDVCEMDFSRTGPWFCELRGRESGDLFHVSGVVTSVRPPEGGAKANGEVSFTWAWHDDAGKRGEDSFVTFRVAETDMGARLVVRHVKLTDAESAQGHTQGWLSTLACLDELLAA